MRTLDGLLEEVSHHRGPLTERGASYADVWDAFNRYVTAVVHQRRTLSVMSFCKIGWRVEELVHGKAKLRPHFQVAEAFARAHHVDTRGLISVPDRNLTTVEEFNFSKAAIRYAQNLTKDNVFMGLRAIVQHLGAIVSSGQQMSIDLEVGTLACSERELRFAFVADLYLQEGLDVPAGALESTAYRPSATFLPPTEDALALELSGSRHPGGVKTTALGGWGDGGEAAAPPCPPSARSGLSARESVQREALERHVAQVGLEAASATAEHERWEGHLRRCAAEEQRDRDWRRALNLEHSLHLQAQMRQAEERRAEGRRFDVEQASLHAFPNFAEPQDHGASDYIRERRATLKQDLDQQVDTKQLKKAADRQREREMEACHAEAGEKELELMRQEALARRELERSVLTQAWERDRQIRSVRKAIQEHHRAPARGTELARAVDGLQGGAAAKRPLLVPALAAPAPVLSEGPSSCPPSSRPITGSVRRMPLGAAASLSLHRERLGSALRA